MSLTVILGGARSGKSTFAVAAGRRHAGEITYIATAPPASDGPADDVQSGVDYNMANRIEQHRRERPSSWTTVEEQLDLRGALDTAATSMAIVDCLTLWTSNLMASGLADKAVRDLARETAGHAAARVAPTIVISNEVGMGIHPATDLGRRYRDLLGWVNQEWASVATTSLLLVAGRAIELRDPHDIIGPPPGVSVGNR